MIEKLRKQVKKREMFGEELDQFVYGTMRKVSKKKREEQWKRKKK